MTIDCKAVEQNFTVVLFVFQCYLVSFGHYLVVMEGKVITF